jgi:uncharacterized membrane protein
MESDMTFIKLVFVYGSMALCFLLVDLLWLGVFAKGFYQKQLSHLMAEQVYWPAALMFYFIYIAGILVFAVLPAQAAQALPRALLLGALLGFLAYATYELTNWAIIRDWPAGIVALDLAWGTVLTAVTAGVGFVVAQRF